MIATALAAERFGSATHMVPPEVPIAELNPAVDYLAGVTEVHVDELVFSNGPIRIKVPIMQPDGTEAVGFAPAHPGIKVIDPEKEDVRSYITANGDIKKYSVFGTPRVVRRREAQVLAAEQTRRKGGAHRLEKPEGWLRRGLRHLGGFVVRDMLTEEAPDNILEVSEEQAVPNYIGEPALVAAPQAPTAEAHAPAPASPVVRSQQPSVLTNAAFGFRRPAPFQVDPSAVTVGRYEEQADLPIGEGVLGALINSALGRFGTNDATALRQRDVGALAAAYRTVRGDLRAEADAGSANARILLDGLETFANNIRPFTDGRHLGNLAVVLDLQSGKMGVQNFN